MNRIYSSLLLTAALCLAGCATDPVRIAKSHQQKAYAGYGEYVIVEEQAAEFICGPETADDKCPGNPAVPDNVRAGVKAVGARAAPVVKGTIDIVEQVSRILAQLTACADNADPAECKMTVQDQLRIANANLINWINQLLPLVAQLKTAVGR